MYGAGFARTRTAAERFEGESVRRRPAIPVLAPAVIADVDVSTPKPPAPAFEVKEVKQAKVVAKAVVQIRPDTVAVVTVAEKAKIEAIVPVVVDTSPAKPPVDSAKAHVGFKDGTYTGWGRSRHGDIEARVEISDGRIIAASIAQCLTRYSCSWISALPGQVVTRQSAEVDFVSGATESTNAFYYGIQEALKKAK